MQSRVLSLTALFLLALLSFASFAWAQDDIEVGTTADPDDIDVGTTEEPTEDPDLAEEPFTTEDPDVAATEEPFTEEPEAAFRADVPSNVLENVVLKVNEAHATRKGCTNVTPSLAGFRLVDVRKPSQPEGHELIKDSMTGFVVPAEMGVDFTFTAVPESACVTAVQFLLFDAKGVFIDWDTFRDPPYLEKATKGTEGRFTAFGTAGKSSASADGDESSAFAKGARDSIAGPGTFTLAATPFNGDIEGKDIEIGFEVPSPAQSEFLASK
ncbi:unnamed protein product [Vitrella brassicaformis CCMP3155]|uniref:Uncharacterized protein n=1 Tax=Vitrella brassicaformis (strain CCMP3155) TaxID=1169540 RepID=A0A0G4EKA5_VITBC|nr:unnamed protein product [Vitrella brassicaformis CCMP3155]|eukprot:CEL96851.1 unnamed protein product [Vitrella brassicaformis CCMP3155]